MEMSKRVYKTFQNLPWFEEAISEGEEYFVWFFEELLADLEDKDLSLYTYISNYIEDGYMRANIIRNLKLSKFPQPQYIHKFPFLSDEAIDWVEWYAINENPQKKYNKATEEYVRKWQGEPEPEKPATLRGRSALYKQKRKASRQYWLERAILMEV